MSKPPPFIVARDQRPGSGDIRILSRRYAKGELVRVRRGVYLAKQYWLSLTPWERYARTTEAVALELPTAAFCYETAAHVWGLKLLGVPSHVHLAVKSPSHAGAGKATTTAAMQARSGNTGLEDVRGYGIFRHCYAGSPVHHRGLNVTPLLQTAVDVMARSSFAKAVILADHLVNPLHFKGISTVKADLHGAAKGLHSSSRQQQVARVIDFADAQSGSPGESLSRAQMHLLGFPGPELQLGFQDSDGFVGRADFFWRELRIIGEFDGGAKYLQDENLHGLSAREVVLAEKKREDRLRALGFTVVRWDWPIAKDPAKLTRKLVEAGLPLGQAKNKKLRLL
ncbi:hypothetical protein [Arthrobacter sp. MA-N2]|uniref:hypothetical protein n=1 Tax=Arthrobacter sp. MA-N2 TaxID=1101188 RepID=UPI0004B7BDE4|nr:hypothetical protein [Arthrobacter sp. MA-N2]